MLCEARNVRTIGCCHNLLVTYWYVQVFLPLPPPLPFEKDKEKILVIIYFILLVKEKNKDRKGLESAAFFLITFCTQLVI